MADLKKAGAQIFNTVGGNDNISQMTHCATRLRFNVKDKSKIDMDKLKSIPGVLDVVEKSGQVQVVIGPDVQVCYRAASELYSGGTDGNAQPEAKKNWFERFTGMMLAIINPMVPSIMGAGMVKAVLALLRAGEGLGWYSGVVESSTFNILNFISDAAFFFMPMILAYSAAQYFKANIGLAITLGGVLLHPAFREMVAAGDAISFLGLNVPLVNYASSLIPIIVTVFVQSWVERACEKVLPSVLKYVVRPMLVLLLVSPIALIVIGPLGQYAGNVLAMGVGFLNEHVSWLVPTVLGATYPLIIMVGMHGAFTPLITAQLAAVGYETINGPSMLPSNIAQGAAALAVAVKTKSSQMRQTAISAGISALMGVTEPALYGVNLKLKKPLIAVMIGGGIGGFAAGMMGLVRYSFGSPGIPTLPVYIGDDPMNIVKALVTLAIAFVVTFGVTMFMKIPTGEETVEKEKAPGTKAKAVPATAIIASPVNGKVIPLSEVQDAVFSGEVLGKGMAVIPDSNRVVAPFDGVVNVFDSKHAIGIASDDGVEILVHVGLDTVALEGRHYACGLSTGDRVKQGDVLLTFDSAAIQKEGYPITTPVIVTNSDDFSDITSAAGGTVREGQPLLNLAAETVQAVSAVQTAKA